MLGHQIKRRQQLITIEEALKTRKSLSKSSYRAHSPSLNKRANLYRNQPIINQRARASMTENSNQNNLCSRYLKNTKANLINSSINGIKKSSNNTKKHYYQVKTVQSEKIDYFKNPNNLNLCKNRNSQSEEHLQFIKRSSNVHSTVDKSFDVCINTCQDQIAENEQKKQDKKIKLNHNTICRNLVNEILLPKIYSENNDENKIMKRQSQVCKQMIEGQKESQIEIQEIKLSKNLQDNSKIMFQLSQNEINSQVSNYHSSTRSKHSTKLSIPRKQQIPINILKKQKKRNQCSINLVRFQVNTSSKAFTTKNRETESKQIGLTEEEEQNNIPSEVIVSNKIIMKKEINKNQSINEKNQITNDRKFKTLKTIQTLKTLRTLKDQNQEGEENINYRQFRKICKIGEGCHSTVWKVKPFHFQGYIAMKKLFNYHKHSQNQMRIMRQVSGHPFIVQFYFASIVRQNNGDALQILMEYFQDGTLENRITMEGTIDFQRVKIYAYQIFRGLHYLHHKGICHCDIKTSNILMRKNKIALGDMGSAKKLSYNEQHSSYICLRSNRAPQLILNCTKYDLKIDIWAAGCVLVEMILGRPIFQSYNSEDLLIQIIKYRSVPSTQELRQMSDSAQKRIKNWKLPQNIAKKNWNQILQQTNLDHNLADLLEKIFSYSPKKRPSAFEILNHRYFDELRNQKRYKEIIAAYGLQDDFFSFLPDQMDVESINEILPSWKKKQRGQ